MRRVSVCFIAIAAGLGTQVARADHIYYVPPAVFAPGVIPPPWFWQPPVHHHPPAYRQPVAPPQYQERVQRQSLHRLERNRRAAQRLGMRPYQEQQNRSVRQAALPRPEPVNPPQQSEIDPRYLPQLVRYETREPRGTIIIDTEQRFLYLVEEGGMARRYGVGVGKPGFEWAGEHKVTRKAEWPDWRPPKTMIAREAKKGHHLPEYMPGGPDNPLGARALYLGSTLYRVHGTNQPWTIGKAVSSGCIRMRNEDVIDLYERVKIGTRVIVT